MGGTGLWGVVIVYPLSLFWCGLMGRSSANARSSNWWSGSTRDGLRCGAGRYGTAVLCFVSMCGSMCVSVHVVMFGSRCVIGSLGVSPLCFSVTLPIEVACGAVQVPWCVGGCLVLMLGAVQVMCRSFPPTRAPTLVRIPNSEVHGSVARVLCPYCAPSPCISPRGTFTYTVSPVAVSLLLGLSCMYYLPIYSPLLPLLLAPPYCHGVGRGEVRTFLSYSRPARGVVLSPPPLMAGGMSHVVLLAGSPV